MKLLKRLMRWFSISGSVLSVVPKTGGNKWFGPGGGTQYDPFARKPAPLKPRPKPLSGAVAVAEPDDD